MRTKIVFGFATIGTILMLSVLIYFGPIRLIMSVHDTYSYITDKTVEIDAAVTEVEHYSDSDWEGYYIHISYAYNNEKYDVIWKDVDDKNEYFVGENIGVKIFQNKPHKLVSKPRDYILLIVVHLFITIIGFMMVYGTLRSVFVSRKIYSKQKIN